MFHTPAHKQTDAAKFPAQRVNPIVVPVVGTASRSLADALHASDFAAAQQRVRAAEDELKAATDAMLVAYAALN